MQRLPRSWVCVAGAAACSGAMALAQPFDAGAYLEFDGGERAAVSYSDFTTQQLTIEAWVRVDSTHPQWATGLVVWGSRDRGSYDFCVGPPDQRRLCFFINYNNGTQRTLHGTTPLEFGQWYFLAATYDGEMARVYVNGQLDAEAEFGDPINPPGEDPRLSIGDDYPGASEFLDGAMDEVWVWNQARSADDIYGDWQGYGGERGDETLLAHYTFDEYGSNLIIDHSGNGRHAHLGTSYDIDAWDPAQARWGVADGRRRFLSISSSMEGEAEPVSGDLDTQLLCINGCVTQSYWTPIVRRHADLHQRDAFLCTDDDSLPYVDTETFLTTADEVTRQNCESAFYKFEFSLPPLFEDASIYGIANADDMGVAFLNGVAISPQITEDDAANLGLDRVDAEGHPLLGWPTADPVYSLDPWLFRPGLNELILAVASDISEFEPAGAEFIAVVRYDCMADWNADGAINTIDFIDYLNAWNARDPEADVQGDGKINTLDVRDWLNAWTFGCPE